MERIMKKVSDSRTEQIQILMPAHINGYKRLFGGKLVEWIDVVAAVVARRHSGCNVTTASIDNLIFAEAAYVNSTVVLIGQMTYVGRTSMEVRVDTFVEGLRRYPQASQPGISCAGRPRRTRKTSACARPSSRN